MKLRYKIKVRNIVFIDYFTQCPLRREKVEGSLFGQVKSTSCAIAGGDKQFCEFTRNDDHETFLLAPQPSINSAETHVDENDHRNDLITAPTTMINSNATSAIDVRNNEASIVQNITQQELSSIFSKVLRNCVKFDDKLKTIIGDIVVNL